MVEIETEKKTKTYYEYLQQKTKTHHNHCWYWSGWTNWRSGYKETKLLKTDERCEKNPNDYEDLF